MVAGAGGALGAWAAARVRRADQSWSRRHRERRVEGLSTWPARTCRRAVGAGARPSAAGCGDRQPLVHYLGAARAANELGEYAQSDELLQKAREREPEAALAIGSDPGAAADRPWPVCRSAGVSQRTAKRSSTAPLRADTVAAALRAARGLGGAVPPAAGAAQASSAATGAPERTGSTGVDGGGRAGRATFRTDRGGEPGGAESALANRSQRAARGAIGGACLCRRARPSGCAGEGRRGALRGDQTAVRRSPGGTLWACAGAAIRRASWPMPRAG